MFAPTLIYPNELLPRPNLPFDTQSFQVPCGCANEAGEKVDSKLCERELMQSLNAVPSPKAFVLFVGGFCDTMMCAVYRNFIAFQAPHTLKAYVSFNCRKFLISWLPAVARTSLPMMMVAHSWGARNAYWALNALESTRIEYFLTLDSVGYKTPKNHPKNIAFWENVYIAQREVFEKSNILAIMGNAWNSVKYADSNLELLPPARHASVRQMIETSSLQARIHALVQS